MLHDGPVYLLIRDQQELQTGECMKYIGDLPAYRTFSRINAVQEF